ncbi:MAG: UvrD-helicase domain-containing protein [Polyangiaceae bacterium]|nr:UvrD-helicase domain-containing protein [Polyangiaceae bacterium]
MSNDDVVVAFQRNVVVAASAGTGKTHRLTCLYVFLTLGLTSMGHRRRSVLHPPLAPDRIVATTFSRAAALEIRTRIERALRAIADGAPDGPFDREIRARLTELDEPPSQGELMLRARRALDAFHEARIETLHGLAADLLRRHAFGLGLSPTLRVVEEEEAEALAFGIIDEALARALEGSEVEVDAARALADSCGGFFRARLALLPFFDRLDDEGLDLEALETSDYLGTAYELRRRLIAAARRCVGSPRANVSGPARALLRSLEEHDAAANDDAALPPAAEPFLQELFAQRKSAKSSDTEGDLFELRDEIDGTSNPVRAKNFAATLREAGKLERRERAILELLKAIRARLLAERLERGVAGFADLLVLARNGLRDHPEVAALARDEIDVLLVDEFQDTSLVQRDLVYLLRARTGVRTAGAPIGSDQIEGHGLFIVGDRKQSIYSFRGADVAVFNRVCGELCGPAAQTELDLPEALCAPIALADLVALKDSYRSLPGIVGFVNAFSAVDFASVSDPASDVGVAYGPAEHLNAVRDPAGERVVFVRDEGEPIAEPILAGAGPSLREAFIAAAIAKDLIDRGGLRPSDVAVLARRRATIPLVELGLARFGVPYVVAGRALYDTLEVRDLASVVRLVLDPRDRHALAHVLRGPLVALSDAALLALATGRGITTDVLADGRDPSARPFLEGEDFAEEASRLDAFRARFIELRPTLLRLPAPDALRTAMESFDFDRVTAALPRAPSRLGNLDRLVHIARERGGSLFAFSRWLDRQIAEEADEAEAVVFSPEDDAVRLLTIHGSKGLDFTATIVVDLGAREQPGFDALRFVRMPGETGARFVMDHRGDRGARLDNPARRLSNRQATLRANAERARITYVGLTRARRTLCMVGGAKPPSSKAMLSTFLAHLGTALDGLVEMESGTELLARTLESEVGTPKPAASHVDDETAERVHLPIAGEIAIATTPLSVFRGCARRFWFRFLLGLEEPVDTGQLDLFEVAPEGQERKVVAFDREDDQADPRVTGRAAHRVLERLQQSDFGDAALDEARLTRAVEAEGIEGAHAEDLARKIASFARSRYATELANATSLDREAEVVLTLDARTEEEPALSLRGTVDLFATYPDRIDVIDYKLGRPTPTLDPYAFQLRAYALALSRVAPDAKVRAGIVFLGGGSEPVWLAGAGGDGTLGARDHEAFEGELRKLAGAFATARASDTWPGEALPTCRRERCGFVTACHRTDEPAPGKKRKRKG